MSRKARLPKDGFANTRAATKNTMLSLKRVRITRLKKWAHGYVPSCRGCRSARLKGFRPPTKDHNKPGTSGVNPMAARAGFTTMAVQPKYLLMKSRWLAELNELPYWL